MFGLEPWQRGTATVVARRLIKEWRETSETSTMRRRKFELILDVRPADGSQRFRATCTDSVKGPVQGDEVKVLVKVGKQKVKLDYGRSRPPKPRKRTSADEARWDRMLTDEPGSAPPPREG
jgi:hypothetical protein